MDYVAIVNELIENPHSNVGTELTKNSLALTRAREKHEHWSWQARWRGGGPEYRTHCRSNQAFFARQVLRLEQRQTLLLSWVAWNAAPDRSDEPQHASAGPATTSAPWSLHQHLEAAARALDGAETMQRLWTHMAETEHDLTARERYQTQAQSYHKQIQRLERVRDLILAEIEAGNEAWPRYVN